MGGRYVKAPGDGWLGFGCAYLGRESWCGAIRNTSFEHEQHPLHGSCVVEWPGNPPGVIWALLHDSHIMCFFWRWKFSLLRIFITDSNSKMCGGIAGSWSE